MNSTRLKNMFRKLSGQLVKTGYAVCLSILIMGCEVQTTATDSTVTTAATRPIPLNTTAPVSTLDSKAALRESIDQVLGTDNTKLPRLKEISYSDPEAGDITITWAIIDKGSPESTKIGAQIDAANILKTLEDSEARFIYVVLIGTFPMQDEYGNIAEIQALSLGFNQSKLDKINWENFQPSNIYDLADIVDVSW